MTAIPLDILGTATLQPGYMSRTAIFASYTLADPAYTAYATNAVFVGYLEAITDTTTHPSAPEFATKEEAIAFFASSGISSVISYAQTINADITAGNLVTVNNDVKKITDKKSRAYEGTTLRNDVILVFKSTTVASGNAVFYLTNDGTSSGTPLFPNGVILDSAQFRAEEGTAPHAFGTAALSNSNKTLTVPVSKLASILGIINLNQSANGSVVKLAITGY